ncbi:hypothetical protein EMMF5_003102 [Cystobasidiomycetes sp. EMM_F5]
MRSTSSVAVLSLAILYLSAAQAHPHALNVGTSRQPDAKQISDLNLFEVHLTNPDNSHKRLPSDVLAGSHHERDELPEDVISAEASTSTLPVVEATAFVAIARDFTPSQPNHLIKMHKSHKRNRRAPRSDLTAPVAEHKEMALPADLVHILHLSQGLESTSQATTAPSSSKLSDSQVPRLQSLFSHITPPVESIYLGISADDSSIVYYKISKGIVPPKEVKD